MILQLLIGRCFFSDVTNSLFSHLFFVFLSCFSAEIEKYEGDELRKDGDTKKYLDIISNKNIKLSERVLIPVQQYPKVRDITALQGPTFYLYFFF